MIVNLSAKDKAGRPITNLKKEDVEILEDGVRQEISVFEFQKLAGEPLAPVSFGTTDASPRIEERNAAASAGKAVVAPTPNNPIRYQDRRLLCLFFDMTSMDPPEQLRAQEAAIKFLQSQMTSSDLVEIMTYSTAIKVVQEWTDNRELLIETLRKLNLGEGSDLADTAATAADENDDSGSFTADETEFNIFNTDRKLSALEDAARKLSIFPEKKALVYFSSGIGKTGVENQSQIKATVNAAVRANVSFYPVDARGLVALPPGGDASTASPRGTGMITGTKQAGIRASFQDSQETLVTLASDTGGKAMLDTNDLTMGIRQAQEDIGSYYIIGYYSKNEAEDGKFRRIKVNLLDKNISAKLDYRTGYYAAKTIQEFQRVGQGTATGRGVDAGRSGERTSSGARSRLFPRGERALLRADLRENSRLGRGADQEGRQANRRFRFYRPGARRLRKAGGRSARQHHRETERHRRRADRPPPPAVRFGADARAREPTTCASSRARI